MNSSMKQLCPLGTSLIPRIILIWVGLPLQRASMNFTQLWFVRREPVGPRRWPAGEARHRFEWHAELDALDGELAPHLGAVGVATVPDLRAVGHGNGGR